MTGGSSWGVGGIESVTMAQEGTLRVLEGRWSYQGGRTGGDPGGSTNGPRCTGVWRQSRWRSQGSSSGFRAILGLIRSTHVRGHWGWGDGTGRLRVILGIWG